MSVTRNSGPSSITTDADNKHLCKVIRAASTNPKTVQEGRYRVCRPVARLEYYVPHEQIRQDTFSDEIIRGLRATKKRIDSKFFYDKRGSEIFREICGLSEYYLTRAETEILNRASAEIASLCGRCTRLVELGSGDAVKTKIILEAMNRVQGDVTYSPIDISSILVSSSHGLLESYNWLCISGVNDTYENGLRLIHQNNDESSLIVFLGSSLGNMDAAQTHEFLCTIRKSMSEGDVFLIGLDLKKDKDTLKSAYNDAAGVTAELNFNLLRRINAEMSAAIDVSKFAHHVEYNESESRIETYLRSKQDQTIEIGGEALEFARDELVLTEYAHKYDRDGIRAMMSDAGLDVTRIWSDSADRYALVACSASS